MVEWVIMLALIVLGMKSTCASVLVCILLGEWRFHLILPSSGMCRVAGYSVCCHSPCILMLLSLQTLFSAYN